MARKAAPVKKCFQTNKLSDDRFKWACERLGTSESEELRQAMLTTYRKAVRLENRERRRTSTENPGNAA